MLGLSVALRRASSSTAAAPSRSYLPAGAHFSAGPSPPSRCSGQGRSVFRRDFHTYTLESESFLYTHICDIGGTYTHTHTRPFRLQVVFIDRDTIAGVCAYNVHLIHCIIVLCSESANTLRQRFLRVFRSRDPRTEIAPGDPTRIIFERKSLHAQTTTTTRV